MKEKYEYAVLKVPMDCDQFERELNQLGTLGFRIVTQIPLELAGITEEKIAFVLSRSVPVRVTPKNQSIYAD